MVLTLEEAKASIIYVKEAHPETYNEMGGDKITDEKIQEALTIADAIAGAVNMSEDELFKKELTRLCGTA